MKSQIDSYINEAPAASREIHLEVPTGHNCSKDHRIAPWANSLEKRIFDVLLAGTALVLISPLLLLIAVTIKLTSRGPVFFTQLRMGKGRAPFSIYKFRTMRVGPIDGRLVTSKKDSRITFLGRVLRRFKMDELPQLVNVLRGEMSFVGPRPKVVGHEYNELNCKPGITGAATLIFAHEEHLLARIPDDQIESFTVEVLHRIKADLDRAYERDSSFTKDLKIMFMTPVQISGLKRFKMPVKLPAASDDRAADEATISRFQHVAAEEPAQPVDHTPPARNIVRTMPAFGNTEQLLNNPAANAVGYQAEV